MSPGKGLSAELGFGSGLNGDIASSRYNGELLHKTEDAAPEEVMDTWRECHYNNDPAIDNAAAVLDEAWRKVVNVSW
jgi:hypothetical protein